MVIHFFLWEVNLIILKINAKYNAKYLDKPKIGLILIYLIFMFHRLYHIFTLKTKIGQYLF